MSTHSHTFPASAGADLDVGLRSAAGVSRLFSNVVARIRAWLDLRRQLGEIQSLSDRELADIGLDQGDIHRLRRGELFQPVRWTRDDIAREQLPF